MDKFKTIMKGILLAILIVGAIFTTGCNKDKTNSQVKTTTNSDGTVTTSIKGVDGAVYRAEDLFTEKDLLQTIDTSNATKITVKDSEDVTIDKEGVYVISGTSKNTTIYVEVDDSEKVEIVLDGVSITNETMPCIYVKSADKVFINLSKDSKNTLKVTGTFKADGETNLDGVIYSKEDITLNGLGSLNIESSKHGIVSNDDLKITGGTYNINVSDKGIKANDSIRIADGTFNITSSDDAMHSENDEDNSLGYIFIGGGTFSIKTSDDGIRATTVLQIDGGTLEINASEGLEATYIQINNGTININASDDGINATTKSSSYSPKVEINDGTINVTMGQGDTDGVDSNGDVIINGGTVNITGQSTFDYDGEGKINDGKVICNGEEVDSLPNQMMGGGGPQGQGNPRERRR